MEIVEATIHQLQKVAHVHGEGSVTVHTRDSNLPVDLTLERTCQELIALYNRSSDSSGTFGNNPDVHMFPTRLRNYKDGLIGFNDLTKSAVNLIAERMALVPPSSGGYALFLRYQQVPNEFFLIAMLKLKSGAGIDANLGLTPSLHIDSAQLHEAARVNVTRFQLGEEPYLTFIKGARRDQKVTEYFRAALGCESYTSSAAHTKELISAADDFVRQRADLTTNEEVQQERLETRRRLFECLQQNREEINLATAAAAISPEEPQDFIQFSQTLVDGERKYKFDGRFKPDRRTTLGLKRIAGTVGTIRLSFDVNDVRTGALEYDDQRNAIIINRPSEMLRQQIIENGSSATN